MEKITSTCWGEDGPLQLCFENMHFIIESSFVVRYGLKILSKG